MQHDEKFKGRGEEKKKEWKEGRERESKERKGSGTVRPWKALFFQRAEVKKSYQKQPHKGHDEGAGGGGDGTSAESAGPESMPVEESCVASPAKDDRVEDLVHQEDVDENDPAPKREWRE